MSSEKIDWEAFQRAVFLLGMRGVDRLGVMNDDILWTKDWSTIYISNFRRMFRSISIWEARNEESCDHKHAYKKSMEETTNVLAMVQPFHELRPPREDRLEETASRLLGPDTKARCLLLVEDLTRLVRLLLQLRVREGRRRTRFHSSAFYSFEPMQDDLADKLTEQFGKPLEELTHDRILEVMKAFVCTSFFDYTRQLSYLTMYSLNFGYVSINFGRRCSSPWYQQLIDCTSTRSMTLQTI